VDVASIRSALARQISPPSPTPLERAEAQSRVADPVASSYLRASAGIQSQIILDRLNGDVLSARLNPAQVSAIYSTSAALVEDAQVRTNSLNIEA
jgi:hypothetical protein